MGIGIISTNRGVFTFQSADNVIEFKQTDTQECHDVWISGEQSYERTAILWKSGEILCPK